MPNFGYRHPKTAPTETPAPSNWFWVAGIYEGEGSVDYHSSSLLVEVPQKDTWLLYRLRALFGGGLGFTKSCPRWWLTGSRAFEFLWKIYPCLSPRRQNQIQKAMISLRF